jgi:capsular polysaccharide transport system permease protein
MPAETVVSLINSIRTQSRIVFALIMREIITRYGRHNIGFAWLFAEPMLFTGGIVILWHITEAKAVHSLDITAFALTGYSTILIWRGTIGRCALAILPNMSLLVHRNVRPIDFFLARIILEIGGVTISAMIMIGIFVITGLIAPPADILTMLKGWALLCWYAGAMGLLIGGLSEFSELVERLWHPIAYFQLPVSGAFALASWLPPSLRNIVMLFPVPNCVEIFRYGYFGDTIRPYYNGLYTSTICLLITWVGLIVVREASKRLDAR